MATTNKYFKVKNGLDINSNATVDASGNANIAGNLTANTGFVSADTFRLDTTYTGGSAVVGEFSWDSDNETARLLLDGVNLQIGQEHIIRVKNHSASVAIPDRTVVMFAGATGDTVTVSPANSANVTNIASDYLVGITTEEIPADGFGFVTQFGFINNVNTAAWTVGTLLYSDPENAGGLTSTQPPAPGWRKPIAAVTKQNTNAGRILVRALPGVDIKNLEGVNFNSPAINDILHVDSSGILVNSSLATANIANLAAATVTFSGNVIATTNVNATTFNGSGAGLTSIPAANLTGTAANIVYTTTTSLPNVTSVNSTTIPGSSTLLTTSSTLDSSKLNTNTVVTLNATNVAATNVNATTALITGNANVAGKLSVTASSGDEGGEIFLANAATNTTINTGVNIDIFQNKIRFWESGGVNRGAYIDLTSTASTVGTNLLGTSGAMNYEQQQSGKVSGVSANDTTIVSRSFTTNGYPVQVMVTGDAENSTAGGWVKLQLFRDSTAIGKIVHVEMSAGSENVPYALTVIDAPSAGTYVYALKTVSAVSTGTMNFGETDGPVLTMIELSGRKGDTGSSGGISSIAFSSPLTGGTITTSGTVGINSSSTSTANYVVQRDANSSFAGNVITATTFSGSGASLTNIPAGNVTGTLTSTVLGNSAITINGSSIALNATNAVITANTSNSMVIKFDTGSTEGTSLYTFNGSAGKTIDVKAGTGISIAKAANTITLSSSVTQAAIFHYKSGYYYDMLPVGNTGNSTIASGRLFVTPVRIEEATTITSLSISVGTPTAAGTVARLGIYNDSNGLPGSLLVDAGEVSVASSGVKTISGMSTSVSAGYYWFVFVSNATPAVRSTTNNSDLLVPQVSPFDAGGSARYPYVTVTYGALASTFTYGAFSFNSTTPLIQFGV